MFFDSPRIKELIERDEKILEEGKITWGEQVNLLVNEVQNCRDWATRPDSFYDTEEKLKQPNYKKHGTREFWLERLHNAGQKLQEFIDSTANVDSEKLESIANEIKNWKKDKDERATEYPWPDVALSILKNPSKVELDYDTCPNCGKKRVKLYFDSPEWTWATECGRAGDMVICLECRSQEIECLLMN